MAAAGSRLSSMPPPAASLELAPPRPSPCAPRGLGCAAGRGPKAPSPRAGPGIQSPWLAGPRFSLTRLVQRARPRGRGPVLPGARRIKAYSLTAMTSVSHDRSKVDHYGATYGQFAAEVYALVRAQAFGEDIGQTGWLTVDEQDLFISWLGLDRQRALLDVACGSGRPTLRVARVIGCRVHGVDIHADAVKAARTQAQQTGLGDRAVFDQLDAGQPLPFPDGAFDAVMCVDAINHLPDRSRTLAEWRRILSPRGRLVFTDPIVVTGPLSNEEIAVRSSIGFFLFVPPGLDEALLERVGFELMAKADRTENMARMAERWRAAREQQADELRRIEGDETFEGQQRFFEVAARLANERRLSRFAFCAQCPS